MLCLHPSLGAQLSKLLMFPKHQLSYYAHASLNSVNNPNRPTANEQC